MTGDKNNRQLRENNDATFDWLSYSLLLICYHRLRRIEHFKEGGGGSGYRPTKVVF